MCLLRSRRGFTLVELLITISIIGILASMVLFAMFQSQQTANAHKTRALITKLNSIIMRRYDEYRTRRVPIQFTPNELAAGPQAMAKIRVDCLRDIMRMEMPDRWSDVLDGPVSPLNRLPADRMQRPAASQAYLNRYNAIVGNTTWPVTAADPDRIFRFQGAECLYMIVMESLAQEGDSRDFFKATDIADTDEDGFPEFVDAWNQPIQFIRWAPGFQSELQTPILFEATTSSPSAQRVEVNVTANLSRERLSQTPGSYVGGTLALVDPTSKIIDTRSMAKITGYRYDITVPSVTFTCETPTTTMQPPFAFPPPASGTFVVLQPDPFDPRGVYPIYNPGSATPPTPDTSVSTFALYPLIISGGPDRAKGIKDDASALSTGRLRYANPATPNAPLSPFVIPPAVTEPFGLFLGSVPRDEPNDPQWYYGCHNDNITNHQLSTR